MYSKGSSHHFKNLISQVFGLAMSMQVFDIIHKPHFHEIICRIEEWTYYPYVKSFDYNDIVEIDFPVDGILLKLRKQLEMVPFL